MKCKNCNGTGNVIFYDSEVESTDIEKCIHCNGKGVVEPLTNEEWFCSLSTKEKAKVLRRKTHGNDEENERIEQGWVNWLKAKHEDNPPDIPGVPSWDRWLEGERTKCEYCDGSGAECNLAGKFECPKTPKTEQEYIQTCNTEQLAEWIVRIVDCEFCPVKKPCKKQPCKKQIEVWLKQPRKPIS